MKRRLMISWAYFQKGYGTYLAMPVGIMSFATTIYYLALKGLPFIDKVFPKFHNFLVVIPLIYPIGVLLGWLHYRKTKTFQREQEVIVLSNPYTTIKITPVSIPIWRLYAVLARKEGLEDVALHIEQVVLRSEIEE